MSDESHRSDGTGAELRQFEKNRFFQGKLMTARDMETEQQYHADRLHTVTRLAVGRGILHGLAISAVEERDDELAITIEPGVGIDGWGRPIVVEHTTTATPSVPEADEIYLYLSFDESTFESVPVPDVRGASDREYESNRTVEGFELTVRETPPETTGPPDANARGDGESDSTARAQSVANDYHQRHRSPYEMPGDPSIFVGAFERGSDDAWTESETSAGRTLVYDNEMLYAALVDHVTDTENPHRTAGGTPVEPTDADEFGEQVRAMRVELDEISDRLDTLNRYLMRKSLKDKIRFFGHIAEEFKDHDPTASSLARQIVTSAEEGMDNRVYDDPEAYRDHVSSNLELDIELGTALEESETAPIDTMERYQNAVGELQTALREEQPIIDIAEAQDGVCEAADTLEVIYDIVRDE